MMKHSLIYQKGKNQIAMEEDINVAPVQQSYTVAPIIFESFKEENKAEKNLGSGFMRFNGIYCTCRLRRRKQSS